MSDQILWLMLSQLPLSRQQKHRLLDRFGTVERILLDKANYSALSQQCKTKGKSLVPIEQLMSEAHSRLARVEHLGWQLLTPSMPDFPQTLLDIPDPPILIYACGAPRALCQPLVAIVGSRKATPLGLKLAQRFAAQLSSWGIAVVSGLARGIDTAAHEGALMNSDTGTASAPTSAILANGPGAIYPRQNQVLSERILASGGVLMTENPPDTALKPYLFPERNRLISGLSVATLVIEADMKSGSLVTANQALSQGRDVFAVPGALTNPQARGCHHLIKQGAMLVESPEDIISALHCQLRQLCPKLKRVEQATNRSSAANAHDVAKDKTTRADSILNLLGAQPLSLDEIEALSGLPMAELQVKLSRLELDGQLIRQSGRYFRSS